eukprot:m.171172 g.171172  ORF g.171172 m.171172 type:complete len:240 (+) comp39052_c0_seq32:1146-1865(+)
MPRKLHSEKAELMCMTPECKARFMMSQLQKALPDELLEKYEERVTEESLQLAGMTGLVRCPKCNFGAVMAPEDKVFRCQNSECMQVICRHCKEDWDAHFGLKCSEVQTKSDVAFRTVIEEKMTEAKVRKCHKCNAAFFKEEGCNRMTCRCGATLCYVCCKPNISYLHFCQHVRVPNEKCKQCSACSLWTKPNEDDEMAIAEIKMQAEKEHLSLVQSQSREVQLKIGPDLGPPRKKMRTD